MKNKPLVSIGIPTYNRPNECSRALSSIINQSYENIEVIISDNSENNETLDTIEEIIQNNISSKKITYTKQKQNFGANNNFKYVLSQAKGEYYMWVEDEMELDENYIEQAVIFLENHSDYAIVSSNFFYSKDNMKTRKEDIYSIENHYNIIRSMKLWKTHNNSIFYSLLRKSIIEKIILENNFAEDRNVVSILLFFGKLKVLNNIYNTRYIEKSMSSKKDLYKNMLKAVNKKYYNDFISQMYVGIRAFKRTLNEPLYSKNIFKRIFLATIFMFSSWLYSIYHLNIKKKIIPFLYIAQYGMNYKYFRINEGYLNEDIHLLLLKELKLVVSNYKKYAIFGMGAFGYLGLVIIKNKSYNMPSIIFDNFQNGSFLDINITKPTKKNIQKYECIFITSISYDEDMKKQLIDLGYKGKIIVWKEMYERRR